MQTPVQKLLQNIKALREQNAPKERIQQEIERWQPKIDAFNASQESEAAKLSGSETVAAGAFKVGQGITLGTLDEALAAIGTLGGKPYKETRDALRFASRQFDAENPATGLALETAGAVALPVSAVKLAAKAPGAIGRAAQMLQGTGKVKALGRAVVDGAVAGGVAGGANAESMGDVAGATALGATAGAGLGGAMSAVAAPVGRLAQRAYRSVRSGAGAARGAAEATAETLEREGADVLTRARNAVDEAVAAGRGDEIIAAEAFGVPGLRELRGTRTVSGKAQEIIDPAFAERNARAGQRVEADLKRTLGVDGDTAEETLARLQAEQSARAKPLYDEALSVDRQRKQVAEMMTAKVAEIQARASRMLPAPGQSTVARSALPVEEIEQMAAQEVAEATGISMREALEMWNQRMYREPGQRILTARTETPDQTRLRERLEMPREVQPSRVTQGPLPVDPKPVRMRASETEAERALRRPEFVAEEAAAPRAPLLPRVLQDADVAAAVKRAKGDYRLMDLPDDDIEVLDRVYKDIGGKARAAEVSGDGSAAYVLSGKRSDLLSGIGERSPKYPEAVGTFAGDAATQEVFDLGRSALRENVGATRVTLKSLDPAEREVFRQGAAAELLNTIREMSANPDIAGVTAQNVVNRVFGKQGMATKFKEAFGEAAYKELLPALRQEVKFFQSSNLVRGGSNTADKTVDAAGELGLDLAALAALPSPGRAMQLVGRGMKMLGGDRVATEKARLLTGKGEVATRRVIDDLERILKARATAQQGGSPTASALARVAGSTAAQP